MPEASLGAITGKPNQCRSIIFGWRKGPKIIDHNGIELPDAQAAKRHAETLARGLTATSAAFGGLRHLLNWCIEVTDEARNDVGAMRSAACAQGEPPLPTRPT